MVESYIVSISSNLSLLFNTKYIKVGASFPSTPSRLSNVANSSGLPSKLDNIP